MFNVISIIFSLISLILAICSWRTNVSIAKHQRIVLHTQFKKAYSILANIGQQFYFEESISINQYFKEFHSTTEVQTIYNKYFGPLEPVSESYTIKTLYGKTDTIYPRLKYFNPKMGLIFNFPGEAYAGKIGEDSPVITIDTNGYKNPNTLGIDIFTFIFDKNGKLLPYGTKDYRELDWELPYWYGPESCNGSMWDSSRSCAYYALANIHPTDSNKDYWNDFLSKNWNK